MKTKRVYRFSIDTTNLTTCLPGSTQTNPRFLLKIPYTVKKGRIFLEWAMIDPVAPDDSLIPAFVIKSSSFGTHEYTDSGLLSHNDYGIIACINDIIANRNVTNGHVFFYNKINISDIGYRINNNINLNGLVVELRICGSGGNILAAANWEKFRLGFLIIDDDDLI